MRSLFMRTFRQVTISCQINLPYADGDFLMIVKLSNEKFDYKNCKPRKHERFDNKISKLMIIYVK